MRLCRTHPTLYRAMMLTSFAFLALSATRKSPRGFHHHLLASAFRLVDTTRQGAALTRGATPHFPSRSRFLLLSSQSTRQRCHGRRRSLLLPSSTSTTATREADPLPSNQELVERRRQASRERREARQRSAQDRARRNLQLKRLASTAATTTTANNTSREAAAGADDDLFALRVTVSPELRAHMRHQLRGRERRGRVFVEASSDASRSVAGLMRELQRNFASLRKDSYLVRASVPGVVEATNDKNETVTTFQYLNSEAHPNRSSSDRSDTWMVETDEDVVDLLAKAKAFHQRHSDVLVRPTMVLELVPNPNAPPPAPTPEYLVGMSDPRNSPTLTMLSFYAFPPGGIVDPDAFALRLRKLFKPFQALGRVYVAGEGVNAQMSVPSTVVPNFVKCCQSIPNFGEHIENGINIDPIAVSRTDYDGAREGSAPFKNLHIRVRRQVVADGLSKSYDWQSAGYDMPPLEWHEALQRATRRRREAPTDQDISASSTRPNEVDPLPILLDCRNKYESEIGTFEGAEPLNTENFRDSWSVLEGRLKDVPKDAPIMTFCTGGIRCVKVGAYLTQELGFTNVSRLAAGIIGYDRTLQERQVKDSMFKGTNFVFDGRLGRPITEDALGTCFTCGAETSLICNCRNNNCHKRITQCEQCRTAFQGTCSDACRQRLVNGAMAPRRGASEVGDGGRSPTQPGMNTGEESYFTLEEYTSGFSSPLSPVYKEMMLNTRALIPSGSHMVSGGAQGRLLTQLASMTREGRVLELGTFTGYATACLLEGAMYAAECIGISGGCREHGPYVLTMERDSKAFEVAVRQLDVVASKGFTAEAGDALELLRDRGSEPFRGQIESSISFNCRGVATCELMRVSDALAVVEEMATVEGVGATGPFDLVFVDADKTRLYDYVNVFLSSALLKRGGFIVVDNVLYKGLVLEAAGGEFPSLEDSDDDTDAVLRKNRRQRRLANKMHRFNDAILGDDRAEVTILPLRDGLSVIRKK